MKIILTIIILSAILIYCRYDTIQKDKETKEKFKKESEEYKEMLEFEENKQNFLNEIKK